MRKWNKCKNHIRFSFSFFLNICKNYKFSFYRLHDELIEVLAGPMGVKNTVIAAAMCYFLFTATAVSIKCIFFALLKSNKYLVARIKN